MKEWFPFTDYDFYAYLTSGVVVLFALDFSLTGGQYIIRNEWTFQEGVLAFSVAYVTGQILAIPSAVILEHGVCRWLLRPPNSVMLDTDASHVERVMGFLVGRYYEPFPDNVRGNILDRALREESLSADQIAEKPNRLFQAAYHHATGRPETKARMNDLRNQYGFCRNMAMSGMVAAILLVGHAYASKGENHTWQWAFLSMILCFGMFLRFWKFYSAFNAEVLRAYAFGKP
jgi:hypothetical protein